MLNLALRAQLVPIARTFAFDAPKGRISHTNTTSVYLFYKTKVH